MRKEYFFPTAEGEARILLLIDAFSSSSKVLEGRTKLAKLDFFLRYEKYLLRAFRIRSRTRNIPDKELTDLILSSDSNNIEHRMVRYKFGPWDPAYFNILGSLIGKGFVDPVPISSGIGYKTTPLGKKLADELFKDESWKPVGLKTKLLRKHFDLSGSRLKEFVYENFPEVTQAKMGENL